MKKSHIASLQFVFDSCFVKMFDIKSKAVIEECQYYFNTRTAEQLIYLQQPRASIDASLLDTASLRLTDAVGLQHTATARP